MKFKADDIKNLTFPSGAMGYKKKDVDDFLAYVAKDYVSYNEKLEEWKQEAKIAEEEKHVLETKLEEEKRVNRAAFEKFKEENQALKQQLTSLRTKSVRINPDEDPALPLAQKVALRIEKEAEEEAQKIVANADRYYEEQLKKIERKREEIASEVMNRLSELMSSERVVIASVDTVKQEYSQLMHRIRENYDELLKTPVK